MTTSKWMHAGTIVKMNAINFPDKLGWQDKFKEHTFERFYWAICGAETYHKWSDWIMSIP